MHKLSAPRTQLLLVRVIFIACVAVLIGNALRFAVHLLALDPATPQRGPARGALVNMHRLLQLVIDAETGERVYRMSGQQAQLGPYRVASDQHRAILDAVALQVSGNPSHVASLLHLGTLLATRFGHREPSNAISDRRRSDLTGHKLIHHIQALVDHLESEQVQLLASRDPRSDSFVWTTLAAGFTINAGAGSAGTPVFDDPIELYVRHRTGNRPGRPVTLRRQAQHRDRSADGLRLAAGDIESEYRSSAPKPLPQWQGRLQRKKCFAYGAAGEAADKVLLGRKAKLVAPPL